MELESEGLSSAITFSNCGGGEIKWIGCAGTFKEEILQYGLKLNREGVSEAIIVFDSAASRKKYHEKSKWLRTLLLQHSRISTEDVEVNLQQDVILQHIDKFNFYPPGYKYIKWSNKYISNFIKMAEADEDLYGPLRNFLSSLSVGCKTQDRRNLWNICNEHIAHIDFIKTIAENCSKQERKRGLLGFAKDHIQNCRSLVSNITMVEILLDFPVDLSLNEQKNNYLKASEILQELHKRKGWNTSLFLVKHIFNLSTELIRVHDHSEAQKLFQIAEEILSPLNQTVEVSRLKRSSRSACEWLLKKTEIEEESLLRVSIDNCDNHDAGFQHSSSSSTLGDDQENDFSSNEDLGVNLQCVQDSGDAELKLVTSKTSTSRFDIVVGDIRSIINETEMMVCQYGGTPVKVSLDTTEVFYYSGSEQKNIHSLHEIGNSYRHATITLKVRPQKSSEDFIETIHIHDNGLLDDDSKSSLRLRTIEELSEYSFSSESVGIFLSGNLGEIQNVEDSFEDVMEAFREMIRLDLPKLSNNREVDFDRSASKIVSAWQEDEWFVAYFENEIFNCFNEATGKYILPEDVNEEKIINDVNYMYSLGGKVPGISKNTICKLTSKFMISRATEFCREKERGRNSYTKKSNIIEEISSDNDSEDRCSDTERAQTNPEDPFEVEFMNFCKTMYQKMKASTIKEDNDKEIEMKKLKQQAKFHDETLSR